MISVVDFESFWEFETAESFEKQKDFYVERILVETNKALTAKKAMRDDLIETDAPAAQLYLPRVPPALDWVEEDFEPASGI